MKEQTENTRLDAEAAKAIAKLHFDNVKVGHALRNLRKRQVSRVSYDGGRYVVKSYHINPFRRIFDCMPFNADYADLLGDLTPTLRANFAYRFNCQVTVVDDAGEMDMFHLFGLSPLPSDFKDKYLESGKLLAKIHAKNIFHADTKPPNFVINSNLPAMPPILIIDCDKVRKYPTLPMEKKVFNIAQFIACNSPNVESNLKLYHDAMKAFLGGYAQEANLPREEMEAIVEKAVACALGNKKIEVRMPPEMLKGLACKNNG